MSERNVAIEECAALMERWWAQAEGFDGPTCVIYRNTCLSAAKAIRQLKDAPSTLTAGDRETP